MAKEYIPRDEMIEQTKARVVLGAPRFNTGLEAAIEVATSIPAADVVKVVRCSKCEYWRGPNDMCRGIGLDFGADGFCSDGKPREEEHENNTRL